jgi:hypothetical protein
VGAHGFDACIPLMSKEGISRNVNKGKVPYNILELYFNEEHITLYLSFGNILKCHELGAKMRRN